MVILTQKIFITQESRTEIFWWVNNLRSENGKLIRPIQINFWIETDASLEGWGTNFEGQFAGGRWSLSERSFHINFLELLAIFFSLRAFFSHKESCHIGIRSDNTTAVAYINEMGGMASLSLDRLAAEIWAWCSERDIFITAQYIPGIENFDADHMSRNFTDSTEWQLKVEIFDRICKHFFVPNVDLFASRLNFQVPRFASWSFDPQATYVDAFTISWSNFRPYIFPPFTLLGKILMKILSDKVEKAILIIPFWPAQSWFSLLIPMLISLPVRLPQHKDLVMMPHTGECHPLRKRLSLTVCIVSGNRYLIEDFQNHLQMSSLHLGDLLQSSNTNILGENSLFGVFEGKPIIFDHLKRM
ncbi:uncharacterized protein [Mytilus edulis]|uniref:uncharacterized protein n=1 Tax=Mytilus edulis TaxID=6550 RepID=UPI0039EE8BB1